jgi:hypothetical protein
MIYNQLQKVHDTNTSVNENAMSSKMKFDSNINLEQSITTIKAFLQNIALQTEIEMKNKSNHNSNYEGLTKTKSFIHLGENLSCKQHAKLSRQLEGC